MARLLLTESQALPTPEDRFIPEALTPRELDVLRLIAQGYTNQRSAEILNVSVRTVEYHRANLTAKLNLRSRVELMKYAEENNLI
jgi:DNA-binding CsgD family transcriptional regulator